MKFEFLGTAAAEGYPGMFCTCANCRDARQKGGRSIRGRSQALVDDTVLIDFPADTCMRVLQGKLDLPSLRHCLITHQHCDHLYATDLEMRQVGYAKVDDDIPFTMYGTEVTGRPIREVIERFHLERDGRVRFQPVMPFVSFTIEGKYTVTPLPATHCEGAVIYLISDGEHTILYAHDTGWLNEETWNWLKERRPQLSFVTIDCTFGPRPWREGHMGLPDAAEMLEQLRSIGCVNENTVAYVNHFSHNCDADYDRLSAKAEPLGLLVSYDGCTVTL